MSTSQNATATVETKAQKFTRLAAARISKAVDAMQGAEKLASPNYEYTEAQVAKIETALNTSVKNLARKLRQNLKGNGNDSKPSSFSF